MDNKFNIGDRVWTIEDRDGIVTVRQLKIKAVTVRLNFCTEYEFHDYNFSRREIDVYTNEEKAIEIAIKMVRRSSQSNINGLKKKLSPYFYKERL